MRYPAVALVLAALLLGGCEQPSQKGTPAPTPLARPSAQPLAPATAARLQQLKQLGSEWLEQLADCTTQLDADTRQFLRFSNDAGLANVKQLWHTCHSLYPATELLPGLSPQQQQALDNARANIASPLELPGYIDSIEGYPGSGIVNDAALPLSEASLREQQGLTSEEDVSIGFDVIAFLVWGEQRVNPQLPDRPLRELTPVTYWENGRTDLPVSEHPQNRRRLYLQLATTLLKQDAARLQAVWQKGPLPVAEEEARQWQLRALQQGLNLLDRHPGNSDVQIALTQLLNTTSASAASPDQAGGAVTVATDPGQLRDDVQQAINNLLTRRG